MWNISSESLVASMTGVNKKKNFYTDKIHNKPIVLELDFVDLGPQVLRGRLLVHTNDCEGRHYDRVFHFFVSAHTTKNLTFESYLNK